MSKQVRSRILGFAFRLLYNQFAFCYDLVSRYFFRNQWRTWQRTALSRLHDIPGHAVLEIGVGTGDLLYDLLRGGLQPTGIDLSAAMLRQTRRKAARRGIAGRLALARARSQQLPFAAASFAAVVSTFPSDYIADPATLIEIARVLRPGGRLVIIPGARLLPTDAPNRLLERFADLVYGDKPLREQALERALHEEIFPGLLPKMAAAGLTVDEQGWQRLPTSVVYIIAARKL